LFPLLDDAGGSCGGEGEEGGEVHFDGWAGVVGLVWFGLLVRYKY
jgi:hypothetical protein